MTTAELREEHLAYMAKPWQWRALIRRASISKQLKHVLCTLADYAGRRGDEVRPGLALLAVDSDSSYEQARDAVALARDLGLLFLYKAGNRRLGRADEYWLIIHPDTFELADKHGVEFEAPAARDLRVEAMKRNRHAQVSKARAKKAAGGQLTIEDATDPKTAPIRGHQEPSNPDLFEGTRYPQKPSFEGTWCPLNPAFEGTRYPPTSFKERPRTQNTGPTDDEDLRTAVTVTREDGREEDQISRRLKCPHGNNPRPRKGSSIPRCEDCRTELESPPTVAETIPVPIVSGPGRYAKTKCAEHNLPIAACTFCRRGLPGRVAA